MKKVTKILLSILLVITCSTTMLVGCTNTHNDGGSNNEEPQWVSMTSVIKNADYENDYWFKTIYSWKGLRCNGAVSEEEAKNDKIHFDYYEEFCYTPSTAFRKNIKTIKFTITAKNDAEMKLGVGCGWSKKENTYNIFDIVVKANEPQEIVSDIPKQNHITADGSDFNGSFRIELLNLDEKTRNQFVEWKISNVMFLYK